jgi:hypothetical protein
VFLMYCYDAITRNCSQACFAPADALLKAERAVRTRTSL